ncbi:PorP/SprF family type IX secretion system membrane protein [Flavobacterium sp. 3HN19-14]|uniref:PorP/SprF family type IX secretion system membrane protein n=1 Tax=Flavobacterium sp. 3HN19-14 TaxID=3448133 RepID=UPI003EDEA061
MRTKFVFFALMLMSGVYAQQDAQFTQYMYNTINVNPAYAGSRGVMSAFLLHRTQWVGLDGAPVTNTFSIHTPIENSKIGLGLSIINDRIGISDENNISADISYSIKTSEDWKLSFGFKATASLLSVDFSRLTLRNPGDYAISQQDNIDNRFTPNIGAGIYYHSDKMYFGLSVPNFLETRHYEDNTSSVASEKMHFYFIAGRVFDLSESVKFKPALLTKLVKGAPLQVDVSGNFLINEKFTVGLAYRWSAAFSALAGFQVSDSWYIGYGYDLETTKLANYNSGSHEIFLRYELFKNYTKVISPRFF